MEKSIQYVVTGTELSDEAFNKLEEIETVSNQLAATISEISSTAQQQSRDSERIADMMEEVGAADHPDHGCNQGYGRLDGKDCFDLKTAGTIHRHV